MFCQCLAFQRNAKLALVIEQAKLRQTEAGSKFGLDRASSKKPNDFSSLTPLSEGKWPSSFIHSLKMFVTQNIGLCLDYTAPNATQN
jgi:hypothetical protein